MEALERDRSPRWPTNMTDIIWKLYCKKLTRTRGPANCICLFNSTIIPALSMHLSSCSGLWWIRGDSRLDLDSSSTSISSCFKIIDSASWRRIFWNGWNCVLINCTCQSYTKLGLIYDSVFIIFGSSTSLNRNRFRTCGRLFIFHVTFNISTDRINIIKIILTPSFKKLFQLNLWLNPFHISKTPLIWLLIKCTRCFNMILRVSLIMLYLLIYI